METILFLLVVLLIISYAIGYIFQIFTFNFSQLVGSTTLFFLNIILAVQLVETYHLPYDVGLLIAGFLYYLSIYIFFKDTIYESIYNEVELDEKGLGRKFRYRRQALLKAPPMTFTNSKEVLKYYDKIYEYAIELEKEFNTLNRDKLTISQYNNQYYELVKESYRKMFAKFPHLLTIEEDKKLNFDTKRWVYKNTDDKFDTSIFKKNVVFSKRMIFVDFDITAIQVYYYIIGSSDRKNANYRFSVKDRSRYDRTNKGEVVRMTGYIDNIYDYDGFNDGYGKQYVVIYVEEI